MALPKFMTARLVVFAVKQSFYHYVDDMSLVEALLTYMLKTVF